MRESIWMEEARKQEGWPELQNHKVDVAIVGGGLTGILTAYMLQEKGIQAEVFEAETIGAGMTGYTTAKITSQHNLIYDRLIKQFGVEKAREYAGRNEQAISQYESIITANRIDCDFKKESAYVYTTKDTANIKAEVNAAKKLGINAYYTDMTSLPFEVTGAVCFQNQAMFHPIKFLNAIAKGLTIWEHTRVVRIKGNTLEVQEQTERKDEPIYVIEANRIIIATHFPIVNHPGYYFLRMYQERSYIVAVEEKKGLKHGMYIGENDKDYSFRRYGDYILIGGEKHRTGAGTNQSHFDELKHAAYSYYPDAVFCYEWANQDCMTFDSVPYIGRFSKRRDDLYVATGYNKWGMTSSMVAATILTEYMTGAPYRKDSIFSPSRFDYRASKKEGKKHIRVTLKRMIKQGGKLKTTKLYKIPMGQAGIVISKGKRMGVYRDHNDKVHMVPLRCPHLGCNLTWNQEEKTWDCPCHGSRFDYKGRMLSNPSRKDADE